MENFFAAPVNLVRRRLARRAIPASWARRTPRRLAGPPPPYPPARKKKRWLFDRARAYSEGTAPDHRSARGAGEPSPRAALGLNPTDGARGDRRPHPGGREEVRRRRRRSTSSRLYWGERRGAHRRSCPIPTTSASACACSRRRCRRPARPRGSPRARFRRPSFETMPTDAQGRLALYPNNARALKEAISRGFDKRARVL